MANLKFANFATSTIADVGGIAAGDLALNVASGHGDAKFPSLTGSQYFLCVLVDASANREIVKVTARSGDAFTIERAQEGTIARAYSQGDKVELRATKGTFEALQSEISDADTDTKIQCEESADEDIIRIDVGGTEKAIIDSTGLHMQTNDEFITGRNVADSSDIDLIKVNTDDQPEIGGSGNGIKMAEHVTFHTALARLLYGQICRALFENGSSAYTLDVNPATYWCKDKLARWTTELTTAAAGSPSAGKKYCLFIDYSEISDGVALTDGTTQLYFDDVVPVWSDTYGQWMHPTATDDTCIFGIQCNATPDDFIEIIHDGGDFLTYADAITSYNKADVDTTPVDVTLDIPAFCTRASAILVSDPAGDANTITFYWKTTGQTGTTGHPFVRVRETQSNLTQYQATPVFTDASQQISIWASAGGSAEAGVLTDGYYFPRGM